jgi:hypothetical protein
VENPQGYLFMIAANLVRDQWRRAERERRAIRSSTTGAAAEQVTCPAQDVDARSLIALLPPRLRNPFLLHYYGGFRTREVAALLRKPEGTVKADLFAARPTQEGAGGTRWLTTTASSIPGRTSASTRSRCPVLGRGLLRGTAACQGFQLVDQVLSVGHADPLQDLQCLPQQALGLRGMAGGQGAPAQAGQRVRLTGGAGHIAGQRQGLLMAFLRRGELTAEPVHRAALIEGRDLIAPVADVAEDAERLVQGLPRGRILR